MDKEQLKEELVKLGVGAVIGIGGSALLKLGSRVCTDAVLEIGKGVKESLGK